MDKTETEEYIITVREIVVHTVLVEVPKFGAAFSAPQLALDIIRTESPNAGITSRFEVGTMHKYNPDEEDQYQFNPGWPRRFPIIH